MNIAITDIQTDLLSRLILQDPDLETRYNEELNVFSYLNGNLAQLDGSLISHNPIQVLKEEFLEQFAALVGPQDVAETVKVLKNYVSSIGWRHVIFSQQIEFQQMQVPLFCARLAAHINPEGRLSLIQSSCHPNVKVLDLPLNIPSLEALTKFLRAGECHVIPAALYTKTIYLTIYPHHDAYIPAWTGLWSNKENLQRFILDATTGHLIDS